MSKPIPFRHTASRCPGCRQILNGSVDHQGRGAPRPGDLTICASCGEILRFGHTLSLHQVTAEEIRRLSPETAKELLDAKRRFQLSTPRRHAALRSVQ